MKAIMAETATASVTRTLPPSSGTSMASAEKLETSSLTSPRSFQKPSQRQRRRMDAQTPNTGSESPPQAHSSTTPWKLSERKTSSAASPISVSVRSPSVPLRASPSSSPSTQVASQASKVQPATPMSLFQVPNPSLRSDSVPDLVPRRPHA